MTTNNLICTHPDIIQNKYFRWYLKLVQHRFVDDVVEVHHILPRSMGGLDDESNLVPLSLRAHYIAHLLLWKCTQGASHYKMALAWTLMSSVGKYDEVVTIPSRWYEEARLQKRGMFVAVDASGNREHVHKSDPRFLSGEIVAVSKGRGLGRTMPEEQRQSLSEARLAEKNPQHKWYVTTPLGKFNSLGEAAKVHDTSRSIVMNRCRNPNYPNWVFSEDDVEHIIPDISLDEIKAASHDRNKTTYRIIRPDGTVVHEICGYFRDFCHNNGISHQHALLSCRTNKPMTYKDTNHRWYMHSVVKIDTGKPKRKTYVNASQASLHLVITSESGDVLYRLRCSIRHASEHIGVTETALRSAFNNKTPMFNGTNGKTYSKNVPHLYHATIREATPSEIATHTWTILERIVTR